MTSIHQRCGFHSRSPNEVIPTNAESCPGKRPVDFNALLQRTVMLAPEELQRQALIKAKEWLLPSFKAAPKPVNLA